MAVGNGLPVECHAASASGPTLPHDAGIRGSACRWHCPTLQQVGDAETRAGDSDASGRHLTTIPSPSGPDEGLQPGALQVTGLGHNAAWLYLNAGTSAIGGLYLLSLSFRHLGASTYGLYALAATVLGVFGTVDFGLRMFVIRATARDSGSFTDDERRRARGDVEACPHHLRRVGSRRPGRHRHPDAPGRSHPRPLYRWQARTAHGVAGRTLYRAEPWHCVVRRYPCRTAPVPRSCHRRARRHRRRDRGRRRHDRLPASRRPGCRLPGERSRLAGVLCLVDPEARALVPSPPPTDRLGRHSPGGVLLRTAAGLVSLRAGHFRHRPHSRRCRCDYRGRRPLSCRLDRAVTSYFSALHRLRHGVPAPGRHNRQGRPRKRHSLPHARSCVCCWRDVRDRDRAARRCGRGGYGSYVMLSANLSSSCSAASGWPTFLFTGSTSC